VTYEEIRRKNAWRKVNKKRIKETERDSGAVYKTDNL